MEYTSYSRIESKACPGVTFRLLKMTWKRRAALRDQQRATRNGELRKLQDEMAPLSKEHAAALAVAKAAVQPERDKRIAAGMTADAAAEAVPLGAIDFDQAKFRRLMELSAEIEAIDREQLTPQAIEHMLVAIDGLTYYDPDREPEPLPATAALLFERGPDKLYDEIVHEVARELGLLPEEAQNLESPSTSAGVVDGNETPGIATPAAKSATTISAGVRDSTGPANVATTSTA